MELVTGRAGSPHITSQQDRQKHQGIWGTGAYILNTGNNLETVVQSSNNIQIKDGALMSQGALFSVKVGTVDEVTIANGSQGMMRKDVIVARYTYNQGTNTEKAEWAVVQGTPAANNPQIPQITEGDIQAGDATVDTSVFIVTLDGINITSVDVVPELASDIPEIMDKINELNGKTKVEEYTASAWDGHTVYFYKVGQIVICVNTVASQMPQANIDASYCGIPTECIPITNAYTSINEWDGSQYASNASASVSSGSNVIRYRTSATENRERNFTLVWLTS